MMQRANEEEIKHNEKIKRKADGKAVKVCTTGKTSITVLEWWAQSGQLCLCLPSHLLLSLGCIHSPAGWCSRCPWRTLQQRWSHLQAPGISPAHSAAGGSFLSTLTKIIRNMARTKAKNKTEFIAPLADFFSRGKGPDNKPMTDDQVRVYQCLQVFYTSDISDLFNDRPWRSSSAGPS